MTRVLVRRSPPRFAVDSPPPRPCLPHPRSPSPLSTNPGTRHRAVDYLRSPVESSPPCSRDSLRTVRCAPVFRGHRLRPSDPTPVASALALVVRRGLDFDYHTLVLVFLDSPSVLFSFAPVDGPRAGAAAASRSLARGRSPRSPPPSSPHSPRLPPCPRLYSICLFPVVPFRSFVRSFVSALACDDREPPRVVPFEPRSRVRARAEIEPTTALVQ